MDLGFDLLVSDILWLRFIQYIGDTRQRTEDNFSQSYWFLKTVTELDPNFISAYCFAAFVLGGEQKKYELVESLVQQGMKSNGSNWYLPFIAGVNAYLYAHDYKAAARYYRRAAALQNAPSWLARQATILEAEIPRKVKDINVWESVYRSALDPATRANARRKLIHLWREVQSVAPSQVIRLRAEHELEKLNLY